MLLVTRLLVGKCCMHNVLCSWKGYVATSRIAIVDMFPTSRHFTSTLMNLIKIPSHETFYRLECGWGRVELVHAWR